MSGNNAKCAKSASLGTVVICTALGLEYTAVQDHLDDPLTEREERDVNGTLYEIGTFSTLYGQWTIVLVQTGPGNTSAGIELERAIHEFSPQIVLFVGVAGGLKDVDLGDVVIADHVYDYQSGKATGDGFQPRIKTMAASHGLLQVAQTVARDKKKKWQGRILPANDGNWTGPHTPVNGAGNAPRAVIKPTAAGEAVIADQTATLARSLRQHCDDAVAVEMEGYGFLAGAHKNADVEALVVRGISDLLTGKTGAADRRWQPPAARHAAAFAFELLAQAQPANLRTSTADQRPPATNEPTDEVSWQAHWLPRARGTERQSDTGAWYFTGRVAARQRVCDWLADTAQPALVVTGGPGTGKSALLAHLLVASHAAWVDTVPTAGPRPPVGSFDLAVHVSGLSCEDVVQRVADAVGMDTTSPPELLAGLRQRRQTGQPPVVIVADAVEEAASIDEARRIAVLLRNLAGTGAARILAGVRTAPAGTQRAAILGFFGVTIPHLSLESHEFQRNDDVVDYVHIRLTHDDIRDHYRSQPSAALRKISRAIARKAGYNFLIAQLTTLWLTQATTPQLDLARTGWEQRLPETVGEAMEGYVQNCDADASLVRRILTALAFARGSGLSVGRTWLVMSDVLHPATSHTLADLETVFHSAAHYLLERTDDRHDQPTYRLYHHALDEHLQDYCMQYTPQRYPLRAIACGLLDAIPRSEHDGRDWAAADVYTRMHLASHAAQAGQLDDLLRDPGFLVHAQPGPLLDALAHTRTEQGQLTAAVYRLSARRHRHAQPLDRCRILALDAARLGASELRHDLNTFQNQLMRAD